jgi:hypothetical protein
MIFLVIFVGFFEMETKEVGGGEGEEKRGGFT